MILKIPIKLRVILLGLLLTTFIGFSSVPEDGRFPKDPKVAVIPEYTDYFKDSYQASRLDFLIRAGELALKFKGTEKLAIAVPSGASKDLFVDVLYIPAIKKSETLLVISCGTHGVEGYAGKRYCKASINIPKDCIMEAKSLNLKWLLSSLT